MKPIDTRILAKAEKILAHKFAAADEMVAGVSQQMMRDQGEWLDSVMKDILPPHLYEAGKRQENLEELAAYVAKHDIRIVYIPDTIRIRVMVHGKPHAEFCPQFTVDGEQVKIEAEMPVDSSRN